MDQSKFRFRWQCGYRGTTDYMITDNTGTYRAELRHDTRLEHPHDYNCDTIEEWIRDIADSVGILRRYFADKPIPQETIDAFNAWRTAERAQHIREMKARPDRYGPIDENDARMFPPIRPVRAGVYVVGEGWQVV